MNKLFEITFRHYDNETKFTNCSINNAIGIIQTDFLIRGIDVNMNIEIFWDMFFKRPRLRNEIYELLESRNIIIKIIK